MLPVTFQFLIAMLAYAINERMARKLDYVQEEVRVLREALVNATGKQRLAFTAVQRQRLAIKGKALPRTNGAARHEDRDRSHHGCGHLGRSGA
jgi:hypothetical protein